MSFVALSLISKAQIKPLLRFDAYITKVNKKQRGKENGAIRERKKKTSMQHTSIMQKQN